MSIERHANLWHLPLDASSPLDPSSTGSSIEAASVAGRDSIHITGSSGARWAVIKPSLLSSFNPQKTVYVTIRATVKSTLTSGTPKLILTNFVGYTETQERSFASGSYDWTEQSFRILIYGGRVAGGISSQTLKFGFSDSATGSVWVTGIRITLSEEPKDRALKADPHHSTALRGFNFHPLSPKSFFVESKKKYNSNLIRYQIFPSNYETPAYAYDESATDVVKFRAWWDKRMPELEQVLTWARQTDHKVSVAIMTMLGGITSHMSASPSQLVHDEYIKCCCELATMLKGREEVYGIELLNEPSYPPVPPSQGPLDHNYWSIQIDAIREIRLIDPEIMIFVTYAGGGDVSWMDYIDTIKSYQNIGYLIHSYTPFTYTSQSGTSITYPGTLPSGTAFNKDYLRAMLQPARKVQLETGARIYVSEFSYKRWNPGTELVTADAIDLFEEYGWDWTYFAYRDPVPPDPQVPFSIEHDPVPDHANGVLSVTPSPMKVAIVSRMASNESPYTQSQHQILPPINLSVAQLYTDSVKLLWSAPACYTRSFRIEYKLHTSLDWIVASEQDPADVDSYTFTNLAVGSNYGIRVVAVSPYGESASATYSYTPTFVDPYASVSKFAERYSVVKIVPGYSGSCVRVRRSVDNAEQDIGWTSSGRLDVTAMLAFVGSGDGFVSVWYGQCGVVNYVQANTAKQPRIVLAGTVDIGTNGIPAIVFRGTDYLDQSSLFTVNIANGNSICGVLAAASDNPPHAYFYSESAVGGKLNYAIRTNATDRQTASVMVRNDANVLQVGNSFAGVAGHKLFDGNLHRFERYDSLTEIGYYIGDYKYKIQSYARSGIYTPTLSRIGGFADGMTATWRGRVQELLVPNGMLSTEEQIKVRSGQDHVYSTGNT